MRLAYVAASLLLLTRMVLAYDAPLAPVRDLECATKSATRFSQGATTQGKPGGPVAFVKVVASGVNTWDSDSQSCDVRATLHVKDTDQNESEITLGHNANADFDLVDWSPQHNLVLISSEHWTEVLSAPNVTVYNISSGIHRSINVGALFVAKGWDHCAAIIGTTGFAGDGRIVVIAGPGSMQNRPKDCVSSKSYWAFDLQKRDLQQLPAGFQQKRYGKVVSPPYRPCREDPGIVDKCFTIHGRIQYGNGTPGLRIWRVGTDRMLGVFDPESEIIPDNLSEKLTGYEVAVFGDFEVCPFTKRRQGEMQMVCVESASHLVTKHY
jgi:hypothetical protein